MSQTEQAPSLDSVLLRIEAELQRLGWWEQSPPSPQALASGQPFCLDTLRFEQWLQWVLLPRMNSLLSSGASLPNSSGISSMAEVVYADKQVLVRRLIDHLTCFDRLLADA